MKKRARFTVVQSVFLAMQVEFEIVLNIFVNFSKRKLRQSCALMSAS